MKKIHEISDRLESDVEYLTDCRNNIAVNKLMDYPVVRNLWLYHPGVNKVVGAAFMWFAPLGLPIYLAGIRAQRNLKEEMKKIAEVSDTIIGLLETESDHS